MADQIRDITATIGKRISYLRIMEWDRTQRSFNKTDPTFWATYRKITSSASAKTLPPLGTGNNIVKYLGILLHHKMLWNSAFDDRIAKTLKVPAPFYLRIDYKSSLNLQLRLNIYKVCIGPVLAYGAQAWWNT